MIRYIYMSGTSARALSSLGISKYRVGELDLEEMMHMFVSEILAENDSVKRRRIYAKAKKVFAYGEETMNVDDVIEFASAYSILGVDDLEIFEHLNDILYMETHYKKVFKVMLPVIMMKLKVKHLAHRAVTFPESRAKVFLQIMAGIRLVKNRQVKAALKEYINIELVSILNTDDQYLPSATTLMEMRKALFSRLLTSSNVRKVYAKFQQAIQKKTGKKTAKA